MSFKQKLGIIIKKNKSLLCIGLDSDLEKLPKDYLKRNDPIFEFNKKIISETYDLVCAYKPNIAFYEAYGLDGLTQLKKTIEYIKSNYPEIPIVLDAKRGDITSTAKMYARSVFEYWGADAVTVYPYLGLDSSIPFFNYKDKLVILLLKTSNPDSHMFQNLIVDNEPYYIKAAKTIKTWKYDNIGIFVGATYPKELKELRNIFPNSIFLSAGIGAQRGEIEKAVKAGVDGTGGGIMFNVSRGIIYSSNSREKAIKIRNEINKYR